MFENPYIIEIICKQKHEELLAECRMIQLARSLKKNNKKNITYPCRFMLYVADILIKSGVSLKRRWASEIKDYDNTYAISQGD